MCDVWAIKQKYRENFYLFLIKEKISGYMQVLLYLLKTYLHNTASYQNFN